MSFQGVPCISTGTTLNNRQVYKAFTSFISQPNVQHKYCHGGLLYILVLVLVVFSLDKEILKWLSICPNHFFTTEKNSKTKTSPQNEENVFLLIRMTQEDEAAKQRNYRLGSVIQVESGKVDLGECTKLSVDERLVAPDPDMLGYRTFVVI